MLLPVVPKIAKYTVQNVGTTRLYQNITENTIQYYKLHPIKLYRMQYVMLLLTAVPKVDQSTMYCMLLLPACTEDLAEYTVQKLATTSCTREIIMCTVTHFVTIYLYPRLPSIQLSMLLLPTVPKVVPKR